MADLPIIFSRPMVLALLAGWKTQTRRILKPDPAGTATAPRWAKGDRLYVRERVRFREGRYEYAADQGEADISGVGYRPSIHMPRIASRITLLVTDVRVERLQDISEADAIAEGLKPETCAGQRMWDPGPPHGHFGDPRVAYRMIWEAINGTESWVENPTVAAISFDVVRRNIAFVKPAA